MESTKYKDHSIVPCLSWFLVYGPGDLDCYQIPFKSVDAAKEGIDKGPEFLLTGSHHCISVGVRGEHPICELTISC